MLHRDPILIKAPLGRVYSFTRHYRGDNFFDGPRLAFIHDRGYARENLFALTRYIGDDPFNYRLLEVWQMVFRKPWTRPVSMHQLVMDLTDKITRGELYVYEEPDLDRAYRIPVTDGPPEGGAPFVDIGVLESDSRTDTPRTMGPVVIVRNNNQPRDVPLQTTAPGTEPEPIESTLDQGHLYHTVGLDTVTATGGGGDTVGGMYDKVYDDDGNQRLGIDNDTAAAFDEAYLQAQDISDMRAEGYRMAAKDVGGAMLLGPGGRLAAIGGNRLARPVIGKFSDIQLIKRFRPYTSGEALLKGRKDWGELGGKLRDAANGKGNFGIGSGTREQADAMGKAWVGEGHKVASDGKTLISSNGMRQYRPPSFKPRLDKFQANFEQRFAGQNTQRWQSNAHLDITD